MAYAVVATLHGGIKGFQEMLVLVRKPECLERCIGNRPHPAGLRIRLVLAGINILISANHRQKLQERTGVIVLLKAPLEIVVVIEDGESLVRQGSGYINLACHFRFYGTVIAIVPCRIVANHRPRKLDMVHTTVLEQSTDFRDALMVVVPHNET